MLVAMGIFAPAPALAAVASASLTRTQLEAASPSASAILPFGTYGGQVARVSLKFDDAPLVSRGGNSWNYTVRFALTLFKVGLGSNKPIGPPQASALTIFRGANQEVFESVAVLNFWDARLARLHVTAVTSTDLAAVPANVRLVLEVEGKPVALFAPTVQPTLGLAAGTLDVVETPLVAGAVDYDFEWVYVDARETASPANPFSGRQPVRVTSPTPRVTVDLSYPAGSLYVRVRAVGRHPAPSTATEPSRRPGAWSSPLKLDVTAGTTRAPVEPNHNWQFQASYAEGSETVSTVSFFDGSLRYRQGQKRIGSEGSRLLTETKHDAEGRPSINFLQAPASGAAYRFEPRFNAVDATNAYDTLMFDGKVPPPASTSTGAGRYYSSNATLTAPHDAYVPDAGGYPFSVAEHTREGSGRLRRSAGFGRALTIGSGHETSFMYGTASSSMLRRLFGGDVGRANYYDRNLQIDANAVATIAYVDPEGKVIASALTGDPPPNLTSVAPSPPPPPPATFRLEENNEVDVLAGLSRSANRLINEAPSDLFFAYDLTGGIEYSVDPGDSRFPSLCESCRYRLRLHITGPDGKPVKLHVGSTRTNDAACTCPSVNGVPVCSSSVPELDIQLGNPTPGACPTGDWTRTFAAQPRVEFCAKLTQLGEYEVVKELTLVDGAIDAILKVEVSSPGFFDLQTYLPPETTPAGQCGTNCDAYCKEATSENTSQYAQCVESCQNPELWAIPNAVEESCTALKQQIDADLATGGILAGQKSHPEQCHVEMCHRLKPSSIYDMRMTAEDSYSQALCKGYLAPLTDAAGAPALPTGCTAESDPIFLGGGLGSTVALWMYSFMENYTGSMPGFPAGMQAQSIWQVAQDPDFDGQALLTGDAHWRMFRSLYMGAKQTALVRYLEDTNGGNCPYWNDERAHVKRPYTFQNVDEALDAAAQATSKYCKDLCPVRVDQWLHELDQACGIVAEPLRTQVQLKLAEYCASACGLSNPLPVLSQQAIGTDPALQQVQALLPGCSLSDIAVEDRSERQRFCNTVCCTEDPPTKCASLLVRLLRESWGRLARGAFDLSESPVGGEFQSLCLDWLVSMWAEGDRVVFSSKDRRHRCSIQLVAADGRAVDPRRVTIIDGPFVEPVSPNLPPSGYTGLAIDIDDGRSIRRVYLFSDCELDWLNQGTRLCAPPPRTTCPPLPQDLLKPEVRAQAKVCQDDLHGDRSRLPWTAALPRLPPAAASVAAERSGREFRPFSEPEQTLACRPCLQELLARLARPQPRDHEPRGTCFELVLPERGEWLAVPAEIATCCRVRLYESSGDRVEPAEIAELAAETAATLPSELNTADADGLPYAGISVRVRTTRGWLTAFLYSDCPFPLTPHCESDCGIAIRLAPCFQDALDAIDPRHPRRRTQTGWRCAVTIDVTRDDIVMVRQTDKRSTCRVLLVDHTGRSLRLDKALGVLGMPRIATSPHGPRLRGRWDYAGVAVTVRLQVGTGAPVAVEAFVYSDCGFRVEEDCWDVAVDWPIDPPPPGDPNKVCEDSVEDLAAQQGRIAVDQAKSEFETFVREIHQNRCIGSKLAESFSYTAVPREYHYTLHYYDQARNLVQTVPPAGVRPLDDAQVATLEKGGNVAVADPDHGLVSHYRYNSLEQVTWQDTPDGGWKRFWYDAAGQLRFSQTSQQEADGKHAYLRYDLRGRVIETGLVSGLTDNGIKASLDQQDFPGSGQGREQVVSTTYDVSSASECQPLAPRNLRGRIASISAESTLASIVTCYSYDPHGHITSLLQVMPGLPAKRIDYEYDVVDGKVRAVHYQADQEDALHHRYLYDADRRLVQVETSRDGVLWERDAAYSYYRHGPLARVELGADRVQGIDYLYGISGWPKGINSDTLNASRDPGRDGASSGTNTAVARDAFATANHYFANDYAPVGAAGLGGNAGLPQSRVVTNAAGSITLSALATAACHGAAGCGLYDGNVTTSVTAFAKLGSQPKSILGNAYRYDQLYRLRDSRSFEDVDLNLNVWPDASTDPNLWQALVDYDANGNITQLKRYSKDTSGADPPPPGRWMDRLTYSYPTDSTNRLMSNQLLHINDSEPAAAFPDDLDDQGTPFNSADPNYAYDLSGRLVRDRAADLLTIHWNASDQVRELQRTNATLEFVYDGLGRRVVKVTKPSTDPGTWRYEYFIRDENGEIRAVYTRSRVPPPSGPEQISLQEFTLIGPGRLGVMSAATGTQPAVASGSSLLRFSRLRGAKQYELNNYLGNVYATVSDRKIPVLASGTVTHYEPEIVNTTDYESFGSPLAGRSVESTPYRFAFSGLERDDEVRGAGNSYYTQARLYDPRVGRWLSPDPVEVATAYSYAYNNPLLHTDPTGSVAVRNIDGSPLLAFTPCGEGCIGAIAKEGDRRIGPEANVRSEATEWSQWRPSPPLSAPPLVSSDPTGDFLARSKASTRDIELIILAPIVTSTVVVGGLAVGTSGVVAGAYTALDYALTWVGVRLLVHAPRAAAALGLSSWPASQDSTADLSKGTTLARNLREQLAIEQAAASPTAGSTLNLSMNDPRWSSTQGWAKMQQIIQPGGSPINVHYLFNRFTGQAADFKIVLPGAR